MKLSLTFALAALAVSTAAAAAPAAFTGPSVGIVAGYDATKLGKFDSNGVNYGVNATYDFALTPHLRVGPTAGVTFSSADATYQSGGAGFHLKAARDVETGLRAGVIVMPTLMVYGKVAYTNARTSQTITLANLTTRTGAEKEGVRYGVGAELGIGRALYTTVGYDRSNYGAGVNRDSVRVGAGFRF